MGMTLLGILVIIITAAVCVHCVFERGRKIGVDQGRYQVLLENIIRAKFDATKQIILKK